MATMKAFALAASLIAAIPTAASAAGPAPRSWCDIGMIQGTYAIQMSGHRPATGGTETVIGVVIRQYDGLGGVEQWDNIKGEVSGYAPNRYGAGTYRVNPDCTVDVEFHPAPTVTIQERGVITRGGEEILTITTLPPPIMVTAVHRKITP